MNEQQTQQLVASIQLGGDMRDFCRHPGFKVLQRFIENKVNDSRKEWLLAPTPQAAEELRIKAKPYAEIETYLKKLIVDGDVANLNLQNLKEQE